MLNWKPTGYISELVAVTLTHKYRAVYSYDTDHWTVEADGKYLSSGTLVQCMMVADNFEMDES